MEPEKKEDAPSDAPSAQGGEKTNPHHSEESKEDAKQVKSHTKETHSSHGDHKHAGHTLKHDSHGEKHRDHGAHGSHKEKHEGHGARHGNQSHSKHRHPAHKSHKKKDPFNRYATVLIVLVALVMLFNQTQISAIAAGGGSSSSSSFSSGVFNSARLSFSGGEKDLSSVDIDSLKSTAHTVAAVLDVERIKTDQDAIDIIISTGTPEYGQALGVTFDDPVTAMNVLARQVYPQIKQDLKQNDQETWDRYINLATKPVGISCEFCCGVGPVGIRKNGEMTCGCAHNPAIQGLTMWLMKNTDYSDAEVLREAMRWKAMWFPRDMVGIGLQVAGGDISSLKELPGMVGGC